MTTSCLFLKPKVTTAEGRVKQVSDIDTYIKPAIENAGLSVIGNLIDGLEVSDISDDIIQKIYQAAVLIIDANCYETSGEFRLSPYLYYYMAVGHSRGNATILVTNTFAHLPHKLIMHHTLSYSYSVMEFQKFSKQFKEVIEEILHKKKDEPDNPIQNYITRVASREEMANLRQQITEMEEANRKELAEARRRIEEMEAEKARQRQGPIIFTRVKQKK